MKTKGSSFGTLPSENLICQTDSPVRVGACVIESDSKAASDLSLHLSGPQVATSA